LRDHFLVGKSATWERGNSEGMETERKGRDENDERKPLRINFWLQL